ncbi:MAG TPA: chorismate synthase [Rectinemataceae bacterium]|nr:chorismate synthase [Rectinemataceae bacterium]
MNRFGNAFRVEIFGESHGAGAGVIVDGCPPGLEIGPEDLEQDLARRRSGAAGTTPRREADLPVFLSGVYQGRSTGSPICILFRNEDTRSSDYAAFATVYRPGHADFTASVRYRGFADPRGSGHFSGRITVGLVAAGAIAKRILGGVIFETRLLEAGGSADVAAAVAAASEAGDSVGGLLELRVRGLPAGLGEPFFDSIEGLIAHAVFAVPGIRGVEFGDGFAAARMRGSQHNDSFVERSGRTATNHAGGANGGISNGNELLFRVAVKPTSTIAAPQRSLDFATGEEAELAAGGRHDACIAIRAAVAVEAAAAIAIADLALAARGYDTAKRGEP